MAAPQGPPKPCLFAAKWGRGDSFMAGGGWQQLKSPFQHHNWSLTPTASWGSALGLQAAWSVHSQPNPRASHSPDVGEAQVRLTNSQKWGPQPLTGTPASRNVVLLGARQRSRGKEVRGPGNTGNL